MLTAEQLVEMLENSLRTTLREQGIRKGIPAELVDERLACDYLTIRELARNASAGIWLEIEELIDTHHDHQNAFRILGNAGVAGGTLELKARAVVPHVHPLHTGGHVAALTGVQETAAKTLCEPTGCECSCRSR